MIRYPQAVQEILASEEFSASSSLGCFQLQFASSLAGHIRLEVPATDRTLVEPPKKWGASTRRGCKKAIATKPGGDGEGSGSRQRGCSRVRCFDAAFGSFLGLECAQLYVDVSENRGISPQIIHFNMVFHYKPSILGYHYFWKHPCGNSVNIWFQLLFGSFGIVVSN